MPATATRASNSRAKGGAALSGACGPQWAGRNAPKDCTSRLVAGRVTGGCLAHGVPEPKAPSSLASEAGVVTRAAFPETARVFGRIIQCRASDEGRYCRPRSILTVATADTVATERARTLRCAAAKAVGSFSNPSRPRDRFFLAGTSLTRRAETPTPGGAVDAHSSLTAEVFRLSERR